jgi:phosphoserine phosphatase
MNEPSYAIFDFDYTLIPHDAIFLFANYLLKKQPWRIFYILPLLIAIPMGLLKLYGSKELKQVYLSILWRLRKEEVEEYAKKFVQEIIIPQVHSELKQEIELLKKQNKILILNTAAPDFFAKYIGEELGFDYTIATRVHLEERQPFFAIILGENNKSYEKIRRMIPYLPKEIQSQLSLYFPDNPKKPEYPVILKNSISYSDSIADLPLLRLTEKAVLINPENPELIREAKEKHWEIRNLYKPYKNKLHKYFLCLIQSLGLY